MAKKVRASELVDGIKMCPLDADIEVVEDFMQGNLSRPGNKMGPRLEAGELLPHRQFAALYNVLCVVPVVHEGVHVSRKCFLVCVE